LISAKQFQPSPIFASAAGAYSRDTENVSSWPLEQMLDQVKKAWPGTSIPTHMTSPSVTKKSFITMTPLVYFITILSMELTSLLKQYLPMDKLKLWIGNTNWGGRVGTVNLLLL
jgi:hypothetical protein